MEKYQWSNYEVPLKVRFHRHLLKDSMETCFEPLNWTDFLMHCKEESDWIIPKSIKCKLYDDRPDDRIGWNQTWIITARYKIGFGLHRYPIGFSNDNIFILKRKPKRPYIVPRPSLS